ncbi:MAG: hypothetical protein AABP62_12555 [Planctomycetota bacterium]
MPLVLSGGCGGPDPKGPGSAYAVMQAEKGAEEKLTASGAKLERKQYPQGGAWAVDLSGKEINDETLAALKGLDHVTELNLSGTTVSDAHVRYVNEVGPLLILNLSKTAVTDAALAQLEAGNLTQLDVTNTKVTAEGVSQFLKKRAEDSRITEAFKTPNVKR